MFTRQVVRRTARRERGIVTVEFAVGTLAAIIVLTTLAWMISLVGVKIAMVDAAGSVARQAARADPAAVRRAEADGPPGATYRVTTVDSSVRVTAAVDAAPIHGLPSYRITAAAEAVLEPGVGSPG